MRLKLFAKLARIILVCTAVVMVFGTLAPSILTDNKVANFVNSNEDTQVLETERSLHKYEDSLLLYNAIIERRGIEINVHEVKFSRKSRSGFVNVGLLESAEIEPSSEYLLQNKQFELNELHKTKDDTHKTDLRISRHKYKFQVQDTVYSYTVPEDFRCCARTVVLVLVICTVHDRDARQAIRTTWGQTNSKRWCGDVSLGFLIGEPSAPMTDVQQKSLKTEMSSFRDIFWGNFTDSYANLTVKSIMALHIASTFCRQARHLMKVDADVFVNVRRLLKYLNSEAPQQRLITGVLKTKREPIRTNSTEYKKWYVSRKEFQEDIYPDYVIGGAYLISMDLPSLLYEESTRTPLFRFEDIYINGILAEKIGVPRTNHSGFFMKPYISQKHFQRIAKDLHRYVVFHPVTPDNLYMAWISLLDHERSKGDANNSAAGPAKKLAKKRIGKALSTKIASAGKGKLANRQ